MKLSISTAICLVSFIPSIAGLDESSIQHAGRASYQFARNFHSSWRALHTSPLAKKRLLKRAPLQAKCMLRPVQGRSSGGNSTVMTSVSAGASSSQTAPSSTKTTKGGTTVSSTTPTTSAPPSSSSLASSIWQLQESYSGSTFFNGWDFWSTGDPTHGIVDYQDSESAWSSGLVEINDAGNAIMRVDTTPVVSGNRKSIRISTQAIFNGGLLVADVVHMPGMCGTWPAFWSNGPNWPNNGEIDIIEGVHASTQNLASLHTRSGCTISSNFNATGVIANPGAQGLNCAADETGNTGCGLRSPSTSSYGEPLNKNGGAVYAMLWDTTGIQVFYFPRGAIPADLSGGKPQPTQWGIPAARWPASTCDPFVFMKDHIAIFDTTLCGDWAGAQSVWTSANYAGQGDSCQTITGAATCQDYVRNHGADFAEAYWEVKSVKLYQQGS